MGNVRLIEDALERTIEVPETPRRIVSLVPSVTELVWDVGAGDRLVGVSRYCTEPAEGLAGVARVGGQKDPDVARIVALGADLVLAVKEENLARDVAALEAAGVAVYVADVRTVEEAVGLIGEIGDVVDGNVRKIQELQAEVRDGVRRARARERARERERARVFCPVWRDPWIAISADTYMHDVIHVCGGAPVLAGDPSRRYPKVALAEIAAARPEVILLPDEPYAFAQRDVEELAAIAPAAVVDGKLLGWYGRRTGAIEKIAEVIARLR
jgi:ABC-type Fe3+-hydroxamate transport system substrate-binding protein